MLLTRRVIVISGRKTVKLEGKQELNERRVPPKIPNFAECSGVGREAVLSWVVQNSGEYRVRVPEVSFDLVRRTVS